jgi:hypothetical protein
MAMVTVRCMDKLSRIHGHLTSGANDSIQSDAPLTTRTANAAAVSSSCSSGSTAPRQQDVGISLLLGRSLKIDGVIHGAQFAAPDDTFGYNTTHEQAAATIHACLRAGIRDFDTAPLYTDSEDKLGEAMLTATAANTGVEVSRTADRMFVGGDEVRVITKTGRLVRQRVTVAGSELGWRPAMGVVPKSERTVTDDYSASGAFVSYAESRARMGAGVANVHTLRMHDADSCGGPGVRQASGAVS